MDIRTKRVVVVVAVAAALSAGAEAGAVILDVFRLSVPGLHTIVERIHPDTIAVPVVVRLLLLVAGRLWRWVRD